MTFRRLVTVAWIVPVLFLSLGASCVPARGVDSSKPLTAQVQKGIAEGQGKFSHAQLDALLKAHVKASGRVDYAALKGDHGKLQEYLAQIAAAEIPSLSRNELLAFLINAYNAYTLDLIVRHYPTQSIKDVASKPWDIVFCNVGGETISLNDIEHKYLRPAELFNDPRMHFAINCASIGCPLLRAEAYTGDKIEAQLDAAVRTCLTDHRYLRLEGGGVQVSSILKWFNEDFTQKHGTLAKFLIPYAPAASKAILEKDGDGAIGYLDYDWNLNDIEK